MQKDYNITIATLILSQEGRKKNKTKIFEDDITFFINKKCLDIIDESCIYYGSSYQGRKDATKKLLDVNIKPPIIIEETHKIIFFPTRSPKSNECIWISYNNLKSYEKIKKITRLTFNNDKKFDIPVTYEIIDNQVNRSMKLEKKMNDISNLKSVKK